MNYPRRSQESQVGKRLMVTRVPARKSSVGVSKELKKKEKKGKRHDLDESGTYPCGCVVSVVLNSRAESRLPPSTSSAERRFHVATIGRERWDVSKQRRGDGDVRGEQKFERCRGRDKSHIVGDANTANSIWRSIGLETPRTSLFSTKMLVWFVGRWTLTFSRLCRAFSVIPLRGFYPHRSARGDRGHPLAQLAQAPIGM